MTDEELQKVVAAVIQSLKTNSKTINQLTAVSSIQENDNIELSQGRRISAGLLFKAVREAMNIAELEDELHKLEDNFLIAKDDGLFYTDAAGNIAMKYTPGNGFDVAMVSRHFKKIIFSTMETAEDGFYYTDIYGNVAMRYTPSEGMDAAKVSKHLASLILNHLNTPEPGFYYTDASGHVAMKYTPSEGFDVAKLSEHFKSLLPAGEGDYNDVSETIYNI